MPEFGGLKSSVREVHKLFEAHIAKSDSNLASAPQILPKWIIVKARLCLDCTSVPYCYSKASLDFSSIKQQGAFLTPPP